MDNTIRTRRVAAVKVADAVNAMEGVPVREYAKQLSIKWVEGKLTGAHMKDALHCSHTAMASKTM